jgi:hypothetical protein
MKPDLSDLPKLKATVDKLHLLLRDPLPDNPDEQFGYRDQLTKDLLAIIDWWRDT